MIYEKNLVFNICRMTRKKVAKTEELPLSEINKNICQTHIYKFDYKLWVK